MYYIILAHSSAIVRNPCLWLAPWRHTGLNSSTNGNILSLRLMFCTVVNKSALSPPSCSIYLPLSKTLYIHHGFKVSTRRLFYFVAVIKNELSLLSKSISETGITYFLYKYMQVRNVTRVLSHLLFSLQSLKQSKIDSLVFFVIWFGLDSNWQ